VCSSLDVVVTNYGQGSDLIQCVSPFPFFSGNPAPPIAEEKPIITSANGDANGGDDNDEDEMEQEEMFVDADVSLGHQMPEWGGPRRGGRFPEPTRFGDWERKGRCTDF